VRKLRWHKQETESSCLPACLRSVLNYYGIHELEPALRRLCKTKPWGTHPINVVSAAQAFGLDAYVDRADLSFLSNILRENIPPIATTFSEDEDALISHAFVVQKISAKSVKVLDPLRGECSISLAEFDKLWSAAGYLVIIIRKSRD